MSEQPTNRKYSFKNATGIIRAIKRGEKVEAIALMFNCATSLVTYYRQKAGLPPASKEHPNKAQIIEAMQAKQKWRDIQKTFGCSSGTISRYNQQMKKAAW